MTNPDTLRAALAEPTQFDYLMNSMERAGQSEEPAAHGYGDKRKAVFAYVRDLERRALTAPAASAAEMVETISRCQSMGGGIGRRKFQCGLPAGHDGDHTAFVETSAPWFGAPQPASEPAAPVAEARKVGDSKFEAWFEDFTYSGKGTKQCMREAYEAGLNDDSTLHSAPAAAGSAEPASGAQEAGPVAFMRPNGFAYTNPTISHATKMNPQGEVEFVSSYSIPLYAAPQAPAETPEQGFERGRQHGMAQERARCKLIVQYNQYRNGYHRHEGTTVGHFNIKMFDEIDAGADFMGVKQLPDSPLNPPER